MNKIVVIIGADTPTGLTTARSIQGLGLTLWGVGTEKQNHCCQSNVWDSLFFVESSTSIVAQLLRWGGEWHKKFGRIVLLLSQDELVLDVSKHRVLLEEWFDFLLPEVEPLERLMDKTVFHKWSEDNGFTVPKTKVVADVDSYMNAIDTLDYPCILKPLVRLKKWDQRFTTDKFIYIASYNDARHLSDLEAILDLADKFVLQEWIPGGDDAVYFCLFLFDSRSNAIDSFCGRKLIQWPRLGGSTALAESHKNDSLLEYSRNILQQAELKGLGSVEYKQHSVNKKYYITEPTVGRNDYQSFIAVTGGHNLTAGMVRLLRPDWNIDIGQLNEKNIRKTVWVDELSTLRAFVSNPELKNILKLIKLFLVSKKSLLTLSFSDLAPFNRLMKSVLGPKIRRLLKK